MKYDMERGIRPEGCTCIMHRGPRGLDGNPDVVPEPAEWEQSDDCPVHPVRLDETLTSSVLTSGETQVW